MVNKILKSIKIKYILLAIILIFAGIYCSISLVNHYNFRSHGWDLGLFNNAIYDYAHFKWNDVSLLLPNFEIKNTLGDHMSLLPILISPFYWIFGSYTMLIFQILAILWGGYGIFTFTKSLTDKKYFPYLAMVHFFLMWGIYSALSFDYHDNVLAAMFVPWFIHFIHQKKYRYAAIYFTLIIISKENMAFWAFFICLGLLINYFKDKNQRKVLSIFSAIAILYFIFVIKVAIPHIFGTNEGYIHFHYTALGDSFGEAIKTIITRPWYTFKLLFINHLDNNAWDGIKAELHLVVLFSGGIALLFRPQYLLMLIPIYAQKLFNDSYGKWGINVQYSIEFAPILTIAVFAWLSKIKFKKLTPILVTLFVISCGTILFVKLEKRTSKWYSKSTTQFYSKNHYHRDFNVHKVHKTLQAIPKNAIVSAQSMVIPHLSFRDEIYHYPYVGDAEYIVLLPCDEGKYPLNKESYNEKITSLKNDEKWEVIHSECLLVFKRKE